MNRVTIDCPPGLVGFDCNTRPTLEQYRAMRALGFRFAGRYLGDLTAEEVDDALASDVYITPIQHAHPNGWKVTHTLGKDDGARAVRDANTAKLPPTRLWFDWEVCDPATTPAELASYSFDICTVVRAPGHDAGVYVGSGMPLTGAELWHLAFDAYWKSFSSVPTPDHRAFQLMQIFHYPHGEVTVGELLPDCDPIIAALLIDLDVTMDDYLHGRARMVASG